MLFISQTIKKFFIQTKFIDILTHEPMGKLLSELRKFKNKTDRSL